MEREYEVGPDGRRWALICQAARDVNRRWREASRCYTHPTRVIVLMHLWSVAHDRPTVWACHPRHWRGTRRPAAALPDQSTMSRRMARIDFERFLLAVGERLNELDPAPASEADPLLRIIDGKPMEVPMHSSDRDAASGRGVRGIRRGYKLHAIHARRPMPEAWAITPMNHCEKRVARRLLKRLGLTCPHAGGYLLADAGYDDSILHDIARGTGAGLRILCPRVKPGTGLGHCYQSPGRLRSIDQLEGQTAQLSRFGPALYAHRRDIERDFAHLVSFGGGLAHLPSWVRRPWRVRRWVLGKLLINAARIVLLRTDRMAA